jgi:hypothetical protein
MKSNMNLADRVIRLLISVAFVVLYFTGTVTGTIGLVLVVLAGIFTLTSILGFCPLYAIFGLSTKKKETA